MMFSSGSTGIPKAIPRRIEAWDPVPGFVRISSSTKPTVMC